MSKLKIILWVLCLLITIGTFYIMVIGTTPPDKTNGNGNPALLALFSLYPAIIGFCYLTVNITMRLLFKIKNSKLVGNLFFISSAVCVALYFPIKSNAEAVRLAIKNSKNDAYNEGWNQFTNTIYFNTYTFFLTFFICIVLGTLLSSIKLFKKH